MKTDAPRDQVWAHAAAASLGPITMSSPTGDRARTAAAWARGLSAPLSEQVQPLLPDSNSSQENDCGTVGPPPVTGGCEGACTQKPICVVTLSAAILQM
jgi:hypothetical protein